MPFDREVTEEGAPEFQRGTEEQEAAFASAFIESFEEVWAPGLDNIDSVGSKVRFLDSMQRLRA